VVLAYEPGDSLAHGLDPRAKLAVQVAFAAAAFAHTTPRGLVALTALVALLLAGAATSPVGAAIAFRFALPFLIVAPILEGIVLGPPWFAVAEAAAPALASYRVLLILLVSAAYVRTTPVRESEAAIGRLVPGRPGRALAVGVALVFRFLPVLQRDLSTVRAAMHARLGTERPLRERMRIVATGGLNRAFARADRLSLSLRARCFAWNPTLPALALSARDLPALALAAVLAVWAAM
jgi:biotin transport system permease protein